MSNRIYVGNLSFDTTEDTLRRVFAEDGRTVETVEIKLDPTTGRSRGFAFVDFGSADDVEAAIGTHDGTTVDGRPIKVKQAREQKARTGGFGRHDSGGYGGGRRNERW